MKNLKTIQTCGACPEQYDVVDEDDNIVGYLRLRHGYFRADYLSCGGETVYTSYPKGDGIFEEDERETEINNALKAINEKMEREEKE